MMPVPPVAGISAPVQGSFPGNSNIMGIACINQWAVIIAGRCLPVGEHHRVVKLWLFIDKGQHGLPVLKVKLHPALQFQGAGADRAAGKREPSSAFPADCVYGQLQGPCLDLPAVRSHAEHTGRELPFRNMRSFYLFQDCLPQL